MGNKINITGATLQGNFALGDNSIAVHQGNQTFQTKSSIGAFDALANQLGKHGVAELDISALRDAIKKDQPSLEVAQKKFGPAVKEWMKSMLGKAIDTSWQIEIGVASSLLATALQQYYGWP